MACYAARGNSAATLSVLETIKSSNLKPNADSYSFVFESYERSLSGRHADEGKMSIPQILDMVPEILAMMQQDEITPSRDAIRRYVDLLCRIDDAETATTVVRNSLQSSPDSVSSKTLFKVALANARIGELAVAKALADKITDHLPKIYGIIRNREKMMAGKDP